MQAKNLRFVLLASENLNKNVLEKSSKDSSRRTRLKTIRL